MISEHRPVESLEHILSSDDVEGISKLDPSVGHYIRFKKAIGSVFQWIESERWLPHSKIFYPTRLPGRRIEVLMPWLALVLDQAYQASGMEVYNGSRVRIGLCAHFVCLRCL